MSNRPYHGKHQTVLMLNYLDLEEEQRKQVRRHVGFHNDCWLEYVSEMSPIDDDAEDTWAKHLSMTEIEAYWKDQCETNNYKQDLQQFIKDYGLAFDVWLLEQGFDLNVRRIMIRVSW